MAKVHPNNCGIVPAPGRTAGNQEPATATVLTVWRKSLLFNCDGFTVFDAKGDLAFRVDCYSQTRRRAEVVLMDVAGKPLLTVRRKRHHLISLSEHWLVYDGDASADHEHAADTEKRPLLSVRRHVSLRRSSSSSAKKALLAHVTSPSSSEEEEKKASYVVEGSYSRAVRDANGDAVAEVRRKEDSPSVGDDVFRLTVPDPRRMGAPLAMGLVIALDEMFSSSSAGSLLLRRTLSA